MPDTLDARVLVLDKRTVSNELELECTLERVDVGSLRLALAGADNKEVLLDERKLDPSEVVTVKIWVDVLVIMMLLDEAGDADELRLTRVVDDEEEEGPGTMLKSITTKYGRLLLPTAVNTTGTVRPIRIVGGSIRSWFDPEVNSVIQVTFAPRIVSVGLFR